LEGGRQFCHHLIAAVDPHCPSSTSGVIVIAMTMAGLAGNRVV